MDIIEGLDLNVVLPEDFDFSLDDILDEYRTPAVPTPQALPEETFPGVPLVMEQAQGRIATGEISSLSEAPEGDPFRLGDILEEFRTPPAPPKAEPANVYEDDDGVKVYTPSYAGKEPTVPTSAPAFPMQEEQNSPTVKFKAPSSRSGRKKNKNKSKTKAIPGQQSLRVEAEAPDAKVWEAPAAAPVAEVPVVPPVEDAEDSFISSIASRIATEGYTDTGEEQGNYAAFGAQDDAPIYDGTHDYMADFGLDSVESPEEVPKPRRRKKKAAVEGEDASPSAPILSAISAVKARPKVDDAPEEDLGPEVDPAKATRHYGSHIDIYRSRLHIAVVLCVILGWLSLGLPVFGSLKNTAVCAAMCLILELTVILLGLDIFTAGIRALVRKKPDAQSLVSVSCIASALDACVIIFTHGEAGYLPFCVISAVSMCFAIYGAMLYCRGQRFNFRVLTLLKNPTSVTVENDLNDHGPTITRTQGYPDAYIHYSEEEDFGETVYGIITPFLLIAIPVLSILAAIISKNFSGIIHILSALFAAAASFSALLAFPLPYFLVQKDLFRSGSAIAGWAGARDLGSAASVVVTDKDLFPEDTVSIESVRILEGVDPETAVSYASSLVAASGSCLAPVFTELVRKNNCILRTVEEFKCHEAGGLTAMIDGAEVLVGSSTFIKLMGIHLPQKLSSKNSVFLAINGKLVGIITVTYKPVVSAQRGLATLLQGKAEVIFAARDFNVTPLLISQKFKMPNDQLNFPSFAERYRITDPGNERKGQCAGVLKRRTLFPFANLVSKARKLYSSVCMSVAFAAISSFAGVILMFFLCCTAAFASASPGNLLLFMLLWLVPTIVFAIGMTK